VDIVILNEEGVKAEPAKTNEPPRK
jgi:hypothetical protein